MASQATIHAHHSQQFEDFQMSATEFYTLLRTKIEAYRYPNVTCTPVTLKEKGLFSPRRNYLRISRGRYNYYVCAAPFGRSFFISWWLKEEAHTAANVTKKFGWIGRTVAARMESKSFFEVDAEQMFMSSIDAIIKMIVDSVKAERGYRKDVPMGGE